MTLEALYFISQMVAAAALVASLVFVGVQLRQRRKQSEHAERTAKANIFQQVSEAYRLQSLSWGVES